MTLSGRVLWILLLEFALAACATQPSVSLPLASSSTSPSAAASARTASAPANCLVTPPDNQLPPRESAPGPYLGNGKLWTLLWPGGVVVPEPYDLHPDGSITMKWPWWRANGKLQVTGRRVDGAASPLTASIPEGYGDGGFQATGLVFSTGGCWEITGSAGGSSLTFVTYVSNPG